jgi:pentatricopeptide repeat protein
MQNIWPICFRQATKDIRREAKNIQKARYSSAETSPPSTTLATNWNIFAEMLSKLQQKGIKIHDLERDYELRAAFAPLSKQSRLIPALLDRKAPSPTIIYACYAIIQLEILRRNVEEAFLGFKDLTDYLYTSEVLIVPEKISERKLDWNPKKKMPRKRQTFTPVKAVLPPEPDVDPEKEIFTDLILKDTTTLVNSSTMKKSWLRIYNITLPDEHYEILDELRLLKRQIPSKHYFDYHILSIFILLVRLVDQNKFYLEIKKSRIKNHISMIMELKLSNSQVEYFANTVLHFLTIAEPMFDEIKEFRNSVQEKFNYTFSLKNYTVLMNSAIRTKRLEMVQVYYDEMVKMGYKPDDYVNSVMVKLYCQSFRQGKALGLVLRRGGSRNTWMALVNVGLSVNPEPNPEGICARMK